LIIRHGEKVGDPKKPSGLSLRDIKRNSSVDAMGYVTTIDDAGIFEIVFGTLATAVGPQSLPLQQLPSTNHRCFE